MTSVLEFIRTGCGGVCVVELADKFQLQQQQSKRNRKQHGRCSLSFLCLLNKRLQVQGETGIEFSPQMAYTVCVR